MSFSVFLSFILIAFGVSAYLAGGNLIIGIIAFIFITGFVYLIVSNTQTIPSENRYIPIKTKEHILDLQRGKCARCGIRTDLLQFHHLKQYAKGGSNRTDNIEALCPTCHYKETRKQRQEYM